MAIALQGEVYQGARTTPIFGVNHSSFKLSEEVVGPRFNFEINDRAIGIMKDVGVFDMSKVLQSRRPTPFEDLLLHSIHWFANSQTQVESENELLSLMTCLESLLTRGGTYIAATVAEGVAILLTTGYDNRKAIFDRIKVIYGKRSSISHGGGKAVLEADLVYLREKACSLLQALILRKDEFNSKSELDEFIDREKLG